MAQHVHEGFDPTGEEPMARWDAVRMSRHLKDAHGFITPMSWDLGRMHLHHLTDHQGPGPINARPEQTEADQLEEQAKALCFQAHPENRDWDDLQQETRDYWRTQVKLRAARPSTPVALICGKINPDYGYLVCDYPPDHGEIVDPVLGDTAETILHGRFHHGSQEKEVWWEDTKNPQASNVSTDSDLDRMRDQAESLAQQLAEARYELETEQSIRSELEETNTDLVSRSKSAQARWAESEREQERLRDQLAMVIRERDLTREARAEAEDARDRTLEALATKCTEAGQLREERDLLLRQVHVQADLLDRSAERAEQHAAAHLRGVAHHFRTEGTLLYTRDAVANMLDRAAEERGKA
jgi:hypothetical protein